MSARDDDKQNDEAAVIRDDIERTRANMSRTVDEIEQRLSPAHLKEQVADLKETVIGQFHEAKEHIKEEIKEEIHEVKDRVRGEIAEARTAAYDATVGRVNHMVEDARETVTDAGTTILGTIRANPIPAALVAVGIGWLFMNARSNRVGTRRLRPAPYGGEELDLYAGYVGEGESADTERYPREAGPRRVMRKGQKAIARAASTVGGGMSNVGHRVADGATNVGQRFAGGARNVGRTVAQGASSVGHRVADTASAVGHRVADGASAVAHGASSAAHRVGDRAGHLVEGARSTAMQVAGDARTTGRRVVRGAGQQFHRAEATIEVAYEDSPMAFGAVALAIGAAVGLALPHTSKEDAWMGDAKEALFERAQVAAHEALHRVEERVSEVASAAVSTPARAEDRSLTTEQRLEMMERDVKGSIGKSL